MRHRPAARAAWEFAVALVLRFREERVTQTAGSLAYTTLLSLVPLLTVALAISTAFPIFDRWIAALQEFVVANVLPDTPAVATVMEQINVFTQNVGKLTAAGGLGFVITAVMLMLTVDNALNRIFRVHRRRSVVSSVLIYWTVISLGPIVVGASLSGTYLALRRSYGVAALDFVGDMLVGLMPFVFTCGALALLYGVVPARRVDWRHALAGGLLAGLGFELAKRGFALYLARVPTYRLIYGAFATIPIFLVWLYVSWLVVLTGAIVTAMLPAYRARPERHRVPGEALTDALEVLSALLRAHEEGRTVGLSALAHRLRVLPERCEEILERAAALGWAARTDRERWVLARDPSSIAIADIYRAFVLDPQTLGVPPADPGLSLRDYLQKEEEKKHGP